MAISSTDLKAILDAYSSSALVAMATFLGVLPPKQRNKSVLINQIIPKITDPDWVGKTILKLSKTDRALLDAVLRRDGLASIRNLRVELTGLKLIDPKAQVEYGEYRYDRRIDPHAENSRRLEDIIARLMIRGLLFAHETVEEPVGYQTKRTFYDATSQVFIPDPIRKLLPKAEPLPEKVVTSAQVKRTQEGSARTFQRDLYLFWSYLRDVKPAMTQKGELLKAALKEINGLLLVREAIGKGETENDHPRLRFLRAILMALKLAQETRRSTVEIGEVTDFFGLQPDQRVEQTFEAWQKTNQYSEVLLLPGAVRPRSNSIPLIPAKPPVIRAREYVVEQVGKLVKTAGKDVWIPFEGLVDRIYEEDYEFFLRRPPINMYYGVPLHPYDYTTNELGVTFPNINSDEEGWQQVEANLIRGMVTGPMFWMGLMDLGWDSGEIASAFRLTALGAWLFKLGPRPEIPAEGGRVIVQPNLHIMALDPIQDAVLATLDRFCERLSAERAVEYRLTRASVYAGQQAGWDAARIKESLESLTGAALPANVARTLDEWQAQYERITIRPHVTILHGDPAIIDRTAEQLAGRGSNTERPVAGLALLRKGDNMQVLTEMLRAQEIWPVINSKPQVPANAVICTESGDIRVVSRTPSLYLHGHLAAFADPLGEGYQISHESVQRAARSGISAPEIIERLVVVNSGSLPEKLTRSIRAWAKHYGSANLAPVTLLQLRDLETLQELLSDPEVGPLLTRFTPKRQNALAQISPNHLEKLRALLAERGVDLNDKLE